MVQLANEGNRETIIFARALAIHGEHGRAAEGGFEWRRTR